jgi:hypothetical protein
VSGNKLISEQYPTLNLAMFESFKGQTPYELEGKGASTRVKFVKTDPLPIARIPLPKFLRSVLRSAEILLQNGAILRNTLRMLNRQIPSVSNAVQRCETMRNSLGLN